MTTLASATPAPTVSSLDQLWAQRRTLAVLAATQTLGGAGLSTVAAVGGLAAAQLSGSAAIGGLALTAGALGAALVGLPLARSAERAGRRTGLRRDYLIAATGAVAATHAVAVGSALAEVQRANAVVVVSAHLHPGDGCLGSRVRT